MNSDKHKRKLQIYVDVNVWWERDRERIKICLKLAILAKMRSHRDDKHRHNFMTLENSNYISLIDMMESCWNK